jgi:hypothetical protein
VCLVGPDAIDGENSTGCLDRTTQLLAQVQGTADEISSGGEPRPLDPKTSSSAVADDECAASSHSHGTMRSFNTPEPW